MIDDGSTDGSSIICNQYTKNDERFKYIFQQNSGVSVARNKGLQIALGEYIAFCDSDDFLEKDMYETLYRLMQQNEADIACCGFFHNSKNDAQRRDEDCNVQVLNAKNALAQIVFDGKVCGGVELWSKLFKNSVVKNVNFPEDISIGEDRLFMFDVLKNSTGNYVYTSRKMYHYVQNPTSACNRAFRESYWSLEKASKILLEKTIKYFPQYTIQAIDNLTYSCLGIARKLVEAGLLNRINYKRIKKTIRSSGYKFSDTQFMKRKRVELRLFFVSRLLYVAGVKVR